MKEMENYRRYWLVMVLAALAVIFGWLYWQRQQMPLHLRELWPATGSRVSKPPARLIFDQDITGWQGHFHLETIPALTTSLAVKKNALVINWPTAARGRYFFRLRLDNKTYLSWQYYLNPKVTPTPPPTPTLAPTIASSSGERGNPQLVRQTLEEIQRDYPLIRYLPFSNQDFAINYQGPRQLVVKIKGAPAARVKDEVLRWLQNHGYQPASHEIIWQ